MVKTRLTRLVSQLLIGTLVLPMGLLQGAPAAHASQAARNLLINEISPEGWVELYSPGLNDVAFMDGPVELRADSGNIAVAETLTVNPGGYISLMLPLQSQADGVTLSIAGMAVERVTWGNSRNAQLPAPLSTSKSLARTVDGAGTWVSNADATPATTNAIDTEDIPGLASAIMIPASSENAADTISAETADDVTVVFTVSGEVDHLAAKLSDQAGTWTELEEDLSLTASEVDGIDASLLDDGAITIRGYTRNNLLLSPWVTGTASKDTTSITVDEAPAAPTSVAALIDDAHRAVISWVDSETLGVDAYHVYSNNGMGDVSMDSPLVTLDDNATTYTTTPLGAGTWKFLVGAVKNGIESTNTTPVTLTVPATDTTAPAKPTNFLATAQDRQVKLTWSSVADAVGYQLRYREATNKGDDAYHTLFLSNPTAQELVVTNLTNGVLYEFGIAAEDSAGNRSAYAIAEQTPTTTPAGTGFVVPSQSTQPNAVQPATRTTTTQVASAPTTTRTLTTDAVTTIQPAPIGGQSEEPAPSTDDTDPVRDDTASDTEDSGSTRTLVTLLIIVIAAAAGFGGYYGYQWWVSQPEESAASSTAPPANDTKKPKRPERGGRW